MSDDEANTTENEYLEMANHCKETIAKKDKEVNAIKEKFLIVFKLLMMCYYVVRMGDSFLSDMLRENPQLSFLVFNLEFMRAEISNFLNKYNDINEDVDSDSD